MNRRMLGRYLAIFLLGFLMGGIYVNIRLGEQVDNLSQANSSLRDELADKQSELKQLKNNMAKQHVQVVTAVQPIVSLPEDKLNKYEKMSVQLEIEKNIKEWLKSLLGQEVRSLNYLLIPEIIDGREIEIENRKYQLHVKMVVIIDKIIIYADAKPEVKNKY